MTSGWAGQLVGPEPRDRAHAWWVSSLAGRNTSEARAGLENEVVDANEKIQPMKEKEALSV